MTQPTEMQVKVYETVKANPGLTPYKIGRLIGGHGGGIQHTLIAMEQSGLLLSEEFGRLYVYEEVRFE